MKINADVVIYYFCRGEGNVGGTISNGGAGDVDESLEIL